MSISHISLKSSTLGDDGSLCWCSTLCSNGFKLVNDILALKNLAEDNVVIVQPGSDFKCDEELRAIGVRTSVGHGKEVWLGEGEIEVLIVKGRPIDRLTSFAVSKCEVTSLSHEVWDDSVEFASLIPHRDTFGIHTSRSFT